MKIITDLIISIRSKMEVCFLWSVASETSLIGRSAQSIVSRRWEQLWWKAPRLLTVITKIRSSAWSLDWARVASWIFLVYDVDE